MLIWPQMKVEHASASWSLFSLQGLQSELSMAKGQRFSTEFSAATWATVGFFISGKEPACQCRRHRFDSWVGKIPWRRKWQPTPIFLPGESHRQRSLEGYRPWGCKELDTTAHTHTNYRRDQWVLLWSLCLRQSVWVTEPWKPRHLYLCV